LPAAADRSAPGALAGLRVLELAQGWAAPLAGRLLGELGATVIKVEEGDGDWLRRVWPQGTRGHSQAFELANVQKLGLLLEHGADAGAGERLRELVRRADVVIVDESWLDDGRSAAGPFAALASLAPATVFCSITPYGRDGAWRSRPANEFTLQAASGVMATTGFPGDGPTPLGPAIADHAGACYAVAAILAALEERRRSGQGQVIDLSIHDCLLNYLFLFLNPLFVSGAAAPRQGNRHLTCAPWNAYACRDGWVQICTSTNQQWESIARLSGRAELQRDPRFDSTANRMRNIDAVDRVVETWAARFSVAEALTALEREGIPAEAIVGLEELLADPQFLARRMRVDLPLPDGDTAGVSGTIYKLSRTPGRVDRPAPLPGEGGEAVAAGWLRQPPLPGAAAAGARGDSLAGLRVVELSVYGAGPFCGRQLAELGAEVIKVEAPAGDPIRHFLPMVHGEGYAYHCYNLDKRGVVLDLKEPDELQRLLALIDTADVFLENLAPGAVERLGLGYDTLAARRPELIYCSVTGFGKTGPYADKRAYDTTVQAAAAVMALTGLPERGPTKVGLSIADLMTPTAATGAILAALYHRRGTGRGQRVDLSMMDVMAFATQPYWAGRLGPVDPDWTAARKTSPTGIYRAIGGPVALSVDSQAEWQALAGLLGLDRLAGLDAGARLARRAEIDERLAAWFAERTVEAALATTAEAGVPAAAVLEVADALSAPQTRSRRLLVEVADPAGRPLSVIQSAFRLSATPGRVRRGGPDRGEHNARYVPTASQNRKRA